MAIKKKINKRALKLISATSMAIFSLFVSITGAFAWFIGERTPTSNTESFYVKKIDSAVSNISVHAFIGETYGTDSGYYAFDPVGVSVYNKDTGFASNAENPVALRPYSIENASHPVMIMFQVEGYQSRIDFTTDYCFIANDTDFITSKTLTYAALSSLSKNANAYYEVINDETHSNKTYLYQYANSTLVNMTYASYAALNTNEVKVAANNNKYFRVLADEEHGGVASIYQYDNVEKAFNLVWIDLGDADKGETNPLSSVVNFHYVFFSGENGTLAELRQDLDVSVESYTALTDTYSYVETQDVTCIPALISEATDDERKTSFTNFTDADTFDPRQKINVFEGEVRNYTYIGVVVNYDPLALEYIFSHNLGHSALNAGLQFVCDWITEF